MIYAPPPRKVSALMPAKVRAFASLAAMAATVCIIASVWLPESAWKLLLTALILIIVSIVPVAIVEADKAKK